MMVGADGLVSAREVESVQFGASVRGYDISEVDRFLGQVRRTLDSYEAGDGRLASSLGSADVESVTFSTALRGYDLDQVDTFLDRVVATLKEYQSSVRWRSVVERTGSAVNVRDEQETHDGSSTQTMGASDRPKPLSSDAMIKQARKRLDR